MSKTITNVLFTVFFRQPILWSIRTHGKLVKGNPGPILKHSSLRFKDLKKLNPKQETGSKSNLTIISFLFFLAGLWHFDYVNGALLGSFFGHVGVQRSKPGFFVEFSGAYSLATSFSDTRMRTIMEF
ncbi:uncharacterized protein OCT59_028002 [Rhizophagus irregularis]|uniref:uncharacterized protein n=1 Tax=Rhizophagus irregularis TaxID=588596 RepID=UPI00331B0345|nr:hypothetical protein OCT59_028002 [Rhizophagus irregularis]